MVITQIDGAAFNVERLKKVAGGKEVYFAVLEFRKVCKISPIAFLTKYVNLFFSPTL